MIDFVYINRLRTVTLLQYKNSKLQVSSSTLHLEVCFCNSIRNITIDIKETKGYVGPSAR